MNRLFIIGLIFDNRHKTGTSSIVEVPIYLLGLLNLRTQNKLATLCITLSILWGLLKTQRSKLKLF